MKVGFNCMDKTTAWRKRGMLVRHPAYGYGTICDVASENRPDEWFEVYLEAPRIAGCVVSRTIRVQPQQIVRTNEWELCPEAEYISGNKHNLRESEGYSNSCMNCDKRCEFADRIYSDQLMCWICDQYRKSEKHRANKWQWKDQRNLPRIGEGEAVINQEYARQDSGGGE